MATLSNKAIADLLAPYYPAPGELLLMQLSAYLDLLLKWNVRTNLSSIREPERIVQRHFGESLFVAQHLPAGKTLLDIGSGAGFPGLPTSLVRPELLVTLAESQNKKAAFLREVVRQLGLTVDVWGARVEDLPVDRQFDLVTLRAVDDPDVALALARRCLAPGGTIAHLTIHVEGSMNELPLPGSSNRVLRMFHVEH